MLPIGTLLKQGEYRVVRYIASGGFGNTYEVEHVRLGKRLAVKEFFMRGINQREGTCVTVSVKDNRDTFDQMRDKFFKEAQRLARLEEPHIVEVTDFFDENQTAYYVMKLIEGESLSAAMKRIGRPFFEYEVRLILPQVLQALKRVHGQGIYHLDLKPGNIMLNAEGHCWLIDFGASKQLSAVESQTLSTSTGLCYTPGYAPSEQVNGNAKRIGPWTDFYALGATLYNLLTNQAPPELDDVKYDGMSAFHFPSSVSIDMRQLVLWLMQPDYPKRPQAVEEIERRLGAKPTVKTVTVKKEASASAGSVATVRRPSVETVKASHAIPINKSTGKKSNSVETVKAEKEAKVGENAIRTIGKLYLWWGIMVLLLICLIVFIGKCHNSAYSDDFISSNCPDEHHPHAIDLGLPSGTKWACCNVGAVLPTDYGGYYAWGETQIKDEYSWESYKYGQLNNFTVDIGTDIAGTQYDVARVRWGGAWQMPSLRQMEELTEVCSYTWTTVDGVQGGLLTGPSGKSLFFPANYINGNYRTEYWISKLGEPSWKAWNLFLGTRRALVDAFGRCEGMLVRPVFVSRLGTDK